MKSMAHFSKMKQKQEKIAMMTAYDYPSARLLEQAGIDCVLVGDSVGMVALGYDSTVPVTLDDILLHTKAVKRGAKDTFIIADMPFMSYHISTERAMEAAGRLIQEGGADAVKLEGAGRVLEVISRLTEAGVPVCAHLGLTPQSVGVIGGYKVQGKKEDEALKLIEDAQEAEKAGAKMLVLECVPKELAGHVTEKLQIPVIGIGAGKGTDGQVLVYHDVMGYGEHRLPKFVKQYANIAEEIKSAAAEYMSDVKQSSFPEDKHSFVLDEELAGRLYGGRS